MVVLILLGNKRVICQLFGVGILYYSVNDKYRALDLRLAEPLVSAGLVDYSLRVVS